jgi:lysozyme
MEFELRGVALVKSWERLRLEAYQDSGGVWTVGYGSTKGVKAEMTITEDQAEMLLRSDLMEAVAAVKRGITVPITQSMFDAFVSLTFNIGARAFAASSCRRLFNSGDPLAAVAAMLMWRKVKGADSLGLARRRLAEMTLALEDGLHPKGTANGTE